MKTTSKVSKEEAEFVKKTVLKCVRLLRKKEYELDLPTNAPDIAVECLSVRKTPNIRSKAGANSISINLIAYSNVQWKEYAAFASNPIIGNIAISSREEYMMVKIAHEVAHHIQMRYAYKQKRFAYNWRKPHGDCFQAIYRYLRRDLINPLLKKD